MRHEWFTVGLLDMNVARETAIHALADGSFRRHVEQAGPRNPLPHGMLVVRLFQQQN